MREHSNRPRLFAIDDSATARAVLKESLTEAGFEVTTAADPSSLDPADLESVRAIIVDVQMEQVFGDDVVSFMRQAWQLDVPIFLFSSLPQEELDVRAAAAGATGAVSKKKGVQALLALLKERLQ